MIKRTSKLWPKFIRNQIRLARLDNYGWGCLGRAIRNTIADNERGVDFWIKRSNWIYNFTRHGIMFKGTK